jgi:hypothetical protein
MDGLWKLVQYISPAVDIILPHFLQTLNLNMSSTQALPKPPHSGVDVPFAPSFVPPFPEGNSQIHPSAHLLPSMKLPVQFESSIEPTISFLSTALNWERLIYQERSKTRYLENLVCGLRIQLQEEKVHSAAKDSKLKEFEQELKRLSLVVDSAAKAHQLKELEEDLQRAFNDQDVTDHQSPQNVRCPWLYDLLLC